jgi:hypothetical protein
MREIRAIHHGSQACHHGRMRSPPAPSRPTLQDMRKLAPWLWVKLPEHEMPAPGADGAGAPHHQMGTRREQRCPARLRAVLQVRAQGLFADGAELGRSRCRLRRVSGGADVANAKRKSPRQPRERPGGVGRRQVPSRRRPDSDGSPRTSVCPRPRSRKQQSPSEPTGRSEQT